MESNASTARFALYFEVSGIAEDGSGNPCPVAMKAVFEPCISADTDHWMIAQIVDIDKLAAFFPLGNVTAKDIRILSPEEYAEKYGDSEEDDEE